MAAAVCPILAWLTRQTWTQWQALQGRLRKWQRKHVVEQIRVGQAPPSVFFSHVCVKAMLKRNRGREIVIYTLEYKSMHYTFNIPETSPSAKQGSVTVLESDQPGL